MKKALILVGVLAMLMTPVFAEEAAGDSRGGYTDIGLGLGYNFLSYGGASTHGPGVGIFVHKTFDQGFDLLGEIAMTFPLRISYGGYYADRSAFDLLMGMDAAFGFGYDYRFTDVPLDLSCGIGLHMAILGTAVGGVSGRDVDLGLLFYFNLTFDVTEHIAVSLAIRPSFDFMDFVCVDGYGSELVTGWWMNTYIRLGVAYRL